MSSDFNLSASAFRMFDTIDATVFATLPDGCHSAEITDIYPGGKIVYVQDPGVAQIFVRFSRRDGPCTDAVVEWEDSRKIPDTVHDTLEVIAEFEGRTFTATTPVRDFKLADGHDIDPGFHPQHFARQFIVIALVSEDHPGHEIGCRIVHEDAVYPAIFRQVYGPASRADCQAWRAEHCLSQGEDDPARR